MEDELDFNLDTEQEQQNIKRNNYQLRIKELSEKNNLTLKEKEDLAKAKQEVEAERDSLTKERDFFKDFSTSSAKYPGATDYQDKILEKVKLGYTVEDATVSVLNSEGKLSPLTRSESRESPAGGSATNSMKGDGDKTLGEMSKAEKRAELEKMQG